MGNATSMKMQDEEMPSKVTTPVADNNSEELVTQLGKELGRLYLKDQAIKQDLANSLEELKKVEQEMHACIDRGEAATNEIKCFERTNYIHNLMLKEQELIKQNRKTTLQVLSTMQASCIDSDVVCGREMWKVVNAASSLNA
jgi:archaellum component FlaC